MFFAFMFLLMLCGGVGVLVWLAWRRIAAHLRKHPDAAKLIGEHVVAVLLSGEDNKPE